MTRCCRVTTWDGEEEEEEEMVVVVVREDSRLGWGCVYVVAVKL